MENILFKKKRLKFTVLVIAAMTAIILLRLTLDQWQGYSKGMDSLQKDDNRAAIMYFDRTLNAHIPFSPIEKWAKDELINLAHKYETSKDYEQALLCYETVRTSRYLTRHFWIPDGDELPFLNDKIAGIKANLLVRDGIVKDYREGYDQQMAIMNKDYSPSVFWSLIVVFSFWIYISSVVVWIFRRKKVYIIISPVAFATWLFALYMA